MWRKGLLEFCHICSKYTVPCTRVSVLSNKIAKCIKVCAAPHSRDDAFVAKYTQIFVKRRKIATKWKRKKVDVHMHDWEWKKKRTLFQWHIDYNTARVNWINFYWNAQWSKKAFKMICQLMEKVERIDIEKKATNFKYEIHIMNYVRGIKSANLMKERKRRSDRVCVITFIQTYKLTHNHSKNETHQPLSEQLCACLFLLDWNDRV